MIDLKKVMLLGSCGVLGLNHVRWFAEHPEIDIFIADQPSEALINIANQYSLQYAEIDCNNEQSLVDGVQAAHDSLGGIDVAIYNSAITSETLMRLSENPFPRFIDYPLELWNQCIHVNLTGAFLYAREVGKIFERNKSGSLIFVSSIYGLVSPDHRIYEGETFNTFPAYSASKSGLIGLMRWLATLWAPLNISVNVLSPGGVYNNHSDEFVSKYSNRTPSGRMASPDDISEILFNLAINSPQYFTGQNLVVDGGLSAW